MKKKIVTLCLVAALAVTAIGGTLAYFTDKTQVTTNTFTVGNVNIELDEAVVDVYGEDQGTRSAEGNEYKLIPGHTYTKDPMVTVKPGTEKSYIRMLVTFNMSDEVESILGPNFLPENFVGGWVPETWVSTGVVEKDEDAKTLTYEFRYYTTVENLTTSDLELDELFETFTLPADLTNNEVKELNGLNISVVAHAIQADGLTEAEAWTAFDANPTLDEDMQ